MSQHSVGGRPWQIAVSFMTAGLLLLPFGAAIAQSRTVAITIDDLPYAAGSGRPGSLPASPELAKAVNHRILTALRRDHVPATGFVIQKGVDDLGLKPGNAILQEWVNAGFDLGNHTYSHTGLNVMSVEEFETDVVKGEQAFVPLMRAAHRSPALFLRFPYNATGNTQEKHDRIAAFLAQRGYRIAPCTIENEDYVFNAVYVQMLGRHDAASAAKLRAAYLTYTADEVDYYASLNRQVQGYEPPEIMLLHDNKLNADMLPQVLKIFISRSYKFVSLEQAEADTVYRKPDTFVTKYGMMWGYRWARERGLKVNGSLEKEPPDWIDAYGKS